MTLDSKVIGFVVFVTGHARQDSCRWRSCRLPQSQHSSGSGLLSLFFGCFSLSSAFTSASEWHHLHLHRERLGHFAVFLRLKSLSLSLSLSAVVPLSSALGYESVPEYFICRD